MQMCRYACLISYDVCRHIFMSNMQIKVKIIACVYINYMYISIYNHSYYTLVDNKLTICNDTCIQSQL